MSTLLETIELDSAANPTVSIIWMHGLGADGNDFVPLVKELYTSGAVTGGMPSGWVAGGGPGLRRGQILP